jgi:hypothetical protein
MEVKRLTLEDIERELRALEERYGIFSEDFYRHYNRGELDDRRDFVWWAGLIAMRHSALMARAARSHEQL